MSEIRFVDVVDVRDDERFRNGSTHYDSFYPILFDLNMYGKMCSPRGQLVKEIENFEYTLPAYVRFCNFRARKLNLDYIKREFLWYLKGDRKDTSITRHASMWGKLVNADGSINSNYGQYVFGDSMQFDNVVRTLKEDPDSRRASIVILNSAHLLSDTKDVPCTYALNFRIREGRLNMTVRMRSQDAIFGMGNDAPAFSFIHEMVGCALSDVYPFLKLGEYCHSADSFHVYERHFGMLTKIVDGDPFTEVSCPRMAGREEVTFLRSCQFDVIPENFRFSRWLTTFDDGGTEDAEGAKVLR